MRLSILLNDTLLNQAMQSGNYKTAQDVVQAALQLLVNQAAYRKVRQYRGKLHWIDHDEPWTNTTQPQ